MFSRESKSFAKSFSRKLGISDVVLFLIFLIIFHYFFDLAQQWHGEYRPEIEIDLSLRELPKYSFFSLIRAFVGYGFSLLFTLVYGYTASKSRIGEKILIPLLDIAQSIPVLGFMPGLVLGLISIFPHSNFGLELACILMIFTGQAWNMTFSFYASLRSVPPSFYEMANVVGLNWWQKFKHIELPFSAINLAWNSLMSMAGGWFFLIACESFVLGERNFRLPGLGSYMAVSIEKNDTRAIIAGIIAMCSVILFTDFLIWRPIIAWTRKFRLDEVNDEIAETPLLTMMLRDSKVIQFLSELFEQIRGRAKVRKDDDETESSVEDLPTQIVKTLKSTPVKIKKNVKKWKLPFRYKKILKHFGSAIGATFALFIFVWGVDRIWGLVHSLPASEWHRIFIGTLYTSIRVFASIILGSLWAIPFGIWVGLSQRSTRIFQPIIQLLASFPAPMLYPLALMLFTKLNINIGISSTFLMLLGVQWYILFNVLAGAIGISKEMRENLELVGVDKMFQWKKLFLPSVFPALVTGWITAAGGAWNASIVAEYILFQGQKLVAPGLGSLISEATAAGNYPLLAGSLIIMILSVIGINIVLWRPIQKFAETRFRL